MKEERESLWNEDEIKHNEVKRELFQILEEQEIQRKQEENLNLNYSKNKKLDINNNKIIR